MVATEDERGSEDTNVTHQRDAYDEQQRDAHDAQRRDMHQKSADGPKRRKSEDARASEDANDAHQRVADDEQLRDAHDAHQRDANQRDGLDAHQRNMHQKIANGPKRRNSGNSWGSFPCSQCPKTFKKKCGLSSHMTTVHQTKYVETDLRSNVAIDIVKDLVSKVQKNCAEDETRDKLQAIFEEIKDISMRKWPLEFRLRSNKVWPMAKLPQGSWDIIQQEFEAKFDVVISRRDLQNWAKLKDAKKYCSGQLDLELNGFDLFKVQSAYGSSKSKLALKTKFLTKLESLKTVEPDQTEKSRKVPSVCMPRGIIRSFNEILSDLYHEKSLSMKEITYVYQAVQLVIEDERKDKAKSVQSNNHWRPQMEEKLERLERIEAACKNTILIEDIEKDEEALCYIQSKTGKETVTRHSLETAKTALTEDVAVIKQKLASSDRRREFGAVNRMFEVNRSKAYRKMKGIIEKNANVNEADMADFWNCMWVKDGSEIQMNELPASSKRSKPNEDRPFMDAQNFSQLLMSAGNWKCSGPDGVFNFFIKHLNVLHSQLHAAVKRIYHNEEDPGDWFYRGRTILIPKESNADHPSQFRPITCMNNTYKMLTKVVGRMLINEVGQALEPNQFGARPNTLGAKETFLTSKSIVALKSKPHVAWVDAKKAYDSIYQSAILDEMECLDVSLPLKKFTRRIISRWSIDVCYNGKTIISKKPIERGIMQGDSFSPLLFTLGINQVSKLLNQLKAEDDHEPNHLLYMDDIKLFSHSEDHLRFLLDATKNSMSLIGLQMNREKSATTTNICEDLAKTLEAHSTYKYMGFDECNDGRIVEKKKTITEMVMQRIEMLTSTKLNARNLFTAINEHALCLVDYCFGVVHTTATEMKELDAKVRMILTNAGAHAIQNCPERLYLARKQLGRGLSSLELKREGILSKMWSTLNNQEHMTYMRKMVVDELTKSNSDLLCIQQELQKKYGADKLAKDSLKIVQQHKLEQDIASKPNHSTLYKNVKSKSVYDSSAWIRMGKNSAKEETAMVMFQDRNLFWLKPGKCDLCGDKNKSIDHVATCCPARARYEYTSRHDEVVKCVGLNIAKRYGLTKAKRMINFRLNMALENEKALMFLDKKISTDVQVKHNKPDLVIIDKKKRAAVIVDVIISHSNTLEAREAEKIAKYSLLADQIKQMYNLRKVMIIPLAYSPDGLLTKEHANNAKMIGLTRFIPYIQTRIIKKTIDMFLAQRRRGPEYHESGVATKRRREEMLEIARNNSEVGDP